MFIIPRRKPDGIILEGDRRVFGRIICRLAARQTGNLCVEMRIEEKRQGIARAFANIEDSMRSREEAIVGPSFQDVPAVDDVGETCCRPRPCSQYYVR